MRRLLALSGVLIAASCWGDAATTIAPTTAAPATTISAPAPATTTLPPVTSTTLSAELPEVPLPDVNIDDALEAYRSSSDSSTT